MLYSTRFTQDAGIAYPIICGPMFPCSNPSLVAAVSANGGLGVVQPMALTYVYGLDFRQGLREIRRITVNPIGMNALIEKSANKYYKRMQMWVDIALDEGVRFFITSLGNPRWVVDRVHAAGGIVYHDATSLKWAQKGRDGGANGIVAVNNRAGGHAGTLSAKALFEQLQMLNLPLVCAGGIGDERAFTEALQMGYAGVQMGTRFIASVECSVNNDYKQAILRASESDIVLTERITGIPVSVIRTPYVERVGTHVSPLLRRLLQYPRTKYLARAWLSLRAGAQLKRSLSAAQGREDYWQAGKSVAGITRIESVAEIMRRFVNAGG